MPLAIETSGAFSPMAAVFFTDLGKQVTDQLEEPKAYSFLLQRLAVEVQWGNAAAILETFLDYLHCFIYLLVVFCHYLLFPM